MGAEGTVVGTVPVNGLLLDVDGIDVRVPANAVEYLNDADNSLERPVSNSVEPKNNNVVRTLPIPLFGRMKRIALTIFVLALFGVPFYPHAYEQYQFGFVFGGAEYVLAAKKDLACVQNPPQLQTTSGWKEHFEGCYTDLGRDSVIEHAAEEYRRASADTSIFGRLGFKRGWKSSNQIPRSGMEFLETEK